MSVCSCSSPGRTWSDHSDYCYVYMVGYIGEMEAEVAEYELYLEQHPRHLMNDLRACRKRAEAAEAKVARVEALPEKERWGDDAYVGDWVSGWNACLANVRDIMKGEQE